MFNSFPNGHQGQICFADFLACPPKPYGLRYRATHHFVKKYATGIFFLTQNALSGFESLELTGTPNKKSTCKSRYFFYLVHHQGLEPGTP